MASGEILVPRPDADETACASPQKNIGLAGLGLVLAGLAVYANSLSGQFTLDDADNILHNPTIQQGWWAAFHPPVGALTVSGRPLLNLSLALNYQLSGFNVWSYHALNLVIQLLAGLTLFGLVRRTLKNHRPRGRYDSVAMPLAWVIALLWIVHPLQTESVTYIAQRAESLMGLFYLLTMYCFVRGVESSRAWAWFALSAAACLLGMITKEVLVSAPLMVLLYDRTFVAGTFAGAWRRRWKVYAVLAGTWLPLGWVVASISLPSNASLNNRHLAGLSLGMKSFAYGLKQCEAIVHYLWLSFWPHPLVFEYWNEVVTNPWDVAPQIVVLALLLGATVYALWRQPALGFLGTWFFAILAPTSSVVPLAGQTMAEHRVYLSLAAVLVLAMLGLYTLLGRRAFVAGVALAFGLGGLTFQRNGNYRTDLSIWTDTVEKRPDNPRAQRDLSVALIEAGRPQEAFPRYEMAERTTAEAGEAENNLGSALYTLGRPEEAIAHYELAVKLKPGVAQYYYNLGNAYHTVGRMDQARDAFAAAVRIDPNYAMAHNNLAYLYRDNLGQVDQAIAEFEAALRADPNLPLAQLSLADLYLTNNHAADAIAHYTAALRQEPNMGEAHLGLGNAFFMTNQPSKAVPQYQAAMRLLPGRASVHGNYAAVLFQLNQIDEGIHQLEETLRLDPNFPNARDNLAKARQLAQPSASPPKEP